MNTRVDEARDILDEALSEIKAMSLDQEDIDEISSWLDEVLYAMAK